MISIISSTEVAALLPPFFCSEPADPRVVSIFLTSCASFSCFTISNGEVASFARTIRSAGRIARSGLLALNLVSARPAHLEKLLSQAWIAYLYNCDSKERELQMELCSHPTRMAVGQCVVLAECLFRMKSTFQTSNKRSQRFRVGGDPSA